MKKTVQILTALALIIYFIWIGALIERHLLNQQQAPIYIHDTETISIVEREAAQNIGSK